MTSLQLSTSLLFCQHNKLHFNNPFFFHVTAYSEAGSHRLTTAKSDSMCFEEAREKIVKLIHKPPQLSISTFDTAWTAMVPSPVSSKEPCFPNCLNWLLENQCQDGSWARPHHHTLLQKDVLSSTLACLLALKRWGVGQDQIVKGAHFIELNVASATDKYQISPMGFDIIFPSMLEYARELSLNINLKQEMLNDLIHKGKLEFNRFRRSHSLEMEAYEENCSEGLMAKLKNWKSMMKHQRENGSLFNSPSTTAVAYIFHHNADCLDYLYSVVNKFGNAVPAVYPLNIFSQLSTIDTLEKLGISQYFRKDIKIVMDETYRCWLENDEEIFMDAYTCALAFRLLRTNGYDVSSDPITHIIEEECINSSVFGGRLTTRDILRTTFELCKASEIIFPDESALEKENLRLKQYLLEHGASFHSSDKLNRYIGEEVKHVLQYPFYATMERIANRRNIEQHLKTSFCSQNLVDKDIISMSVADFNKNQKIHREELKELERWVIDNRLNELKFARQKAAYCYCSVAATSFSPELSSFRMSFAKNSVLATVIDDFFDVGGSLKEMNNLIHLVEKWDVNSSTECSSKSVLIIFSALKSTISDFVDQAYVRQQRDVKQHAIDIWLSLLNSMLKESEWAMNKFVPTMDEYMNNAHVSIALGAILLPSLYLVGPKLSEELVQHSEYHKLYNLMSLSGRLLNDIMSYKRELKDGKLNAVTLYIINGGGDITEEAAIVELRKMIDRYRRELHKLVLEGKNSVLPRSIKDQFWHMNTNAHQFYSKDDGFTSEEFTQVVNDIMYEPIVVNNIS